MSETNTIEDIEKGLLSAIKTALNNNNAYDIDVAVNAYSRFINALLVKEQTASLVLQTQAQRNFINKEQPAPTGTAGSPSERDGGSTCCGGGCCCDSGHN